MSRIRFVVAVLCLTQAVAAAAETYIVPVWAMALPGADGEWWTQVTAVNPNAHPVTFRVTRAFPMVTAACDACTGTSTEKTVPPFGSLVVQPPSGVAGRRLIAGAFEIESSGPLKIAQVVYRPGPAEIRQRLEIGTRWLSPGQHSISPVERGSHAWRMNAFIVNPTDAPLTASVWSGNRNENEVHAVIPPRSTGVVNLPPPRCNGVPCPYPTTYPPVTIDVHIEADAEFMASVSSIDTKWAVFTIADEAVQ